MNLCIFGSRDIWLREETIEEIVEHYCGVSYVQCLISGNQKGMDLSGERWAKLREVPIVRYQADWNALGNKAGPLRNRKISRDLSRASTSLAIGVMFEDSRGSNNMLDCLLDEGVRYETIKIDRGTSDADAAVLARLR